jgi:hypothetical protein
LMSVFSPALRGIATVANSASSKQNDGLRMRPTS